MRERNGIIAALMHVHWISRCSKSLYQAQGLAIRQAARQARPVVTTCKQAVVYYRGRRGYILPAAILFVVWFPVRCYTLLLEPRHVHVTCAVTCAAAIRLAVRISHAWGRRNMYPLRRWNP